MSLPPKENLISHWKMNDNASNSIIVDHKNNHNGNWTHGYTSSDSVPGKINNALNFDRTQSDYMSVTNHSDFNTTLFSVSLWASHPVNNVLWDRFFTKKLGYLDSNGYEMTLANSDSSNTLFYIIGSNSTFSTIGSGISWAGTGWHHVVTVWNNNTVKVYVDDIYKGQVNIAPVVSNTNPLVFGTNTSPGEIGVTSWNGYMDDIRYYNIALTQSHVDSLWNSGLGTELETESYPLPYTVN